MHTNTHYLFFPPPFLLLRLGSQITVGLSSHKQILIDTLGNCTNSYFQHRKVGFEMGID